MALTLSGGYLCGRGVGASVEGDGCAARRGLRVLTSTTGCSITYASDKSDQQKGGKRLNGARTYKVYRDFTTSKEYVSLLGVLVAGRYTCSYGCYVGHGDGSIGQTAFAPRRVYRLAMRFCGHGCVRKLFLDSKVLGGPACAVRGVYRALLLLHAGCRFGKCIRVGAVPKTSSRLLTTTKCLTSHVDIGLRLPARRKLHALTPGGAVPGVLGPVKGIRDAVTSREVTVKGSTCVRHDNKGGFLSAKVFSSASGGRFSR